MITRHFIRNKTTTIPDNEIWYTSSDGNVVSPYNINDFLVNMVSNNYENGKGVIKFDNRVTRIGNHAFESCRSLTSITLPNSITSIEYSAFRTCASLTSITISNSVSSINSAAFFLCSSLASITIGNNITYIGSMAFYKCTSLTNITCKATTPPTLEAYNDIPSVTTVLVPAESVDAYKAATNWSYYADKIQPIQD